MALGTPVVGATVYSGIGNVINAVCPSGVSAGDVLVLVVGQKPNVSNTNGGTASTPSGWTEQIAHRAQGGYGTTNGVDVGNTNLWFFTKDTVDGTEGGSTFTSTLTVTSAAFGFIVHIPAGGVVEYATATGSQTSNPGASLSVALGSNPGLNGSDIVLWAMSIPTDDVTPNQFSDHTISATGATFDTPVELNEPDSTINNDIGGFSAWTRVLSGASSAAPTIGAAVVAATTNVRGPIGMLRIREITQGAANITEGGATASADGSTGIASDASPTEGADTSSADAAAGIGASFSATAAGDSLSADGTTGVPIPLEFSLGALNGASINLYHINALNGLNERTAVVIVTQGGATATADGVAAIASNAAITESPDASSAAGAVSTAGDGNSSQANQTLASAVTAIAGASLTATGDEQGFTGLSAAAIAALLDALASDDSLDSFGTTGDTSIADLELLQGAQLLTATVTVEAGADADLPQLDDLFNSDGVVFVASMAQLQANNDTLRAAVRELLAHRYGVRINRRGNGSSLTMH
jgi:hypothetical protein